MEKKRVALVIQCIPSDRKSHEAFSFAQDLIAQSDNLLSGIFFYGDGAYHALLSQIDSDEKMELDWSILNAPLCVCVSSMRHRGIREPSFEVVGLGYLAKLYQENDDVIVF